MSLFFVVLSLLLFAIILRFYLNEFSKYFKEINRSIDALIEENSGDIVLPSELTAIEKKINHIKHAIDITDAEGIAAGDIATLIDTDGCTDLSADVVAKNSNSISNELLCRMGERLPVIIKH